MSSSKHFQDTADKDLCLAFGACLSSLPFASQQQSLHLLRSFSLCTAFRQKQKYSACRRITITCQEDTMSSASSASSPPSSSSSSPTKTTASGTVTTATSAATTQTISLKSIVSPSEQIISSFGFMENNRKEIRAALDIGSSQHKMMVAEVVQYNGSYHISKVLHEQQIAVYLNDSFVSGKSKELSKEILSESEVALQTLIAKARSLGAARITGVATAVFRKAKNGEKYLQKVSAEFGIKIVLVTQQMEGELGYLTACAHTAPSPASTIPHTKIVSWDSGGGSFQLTSQSSKTKVISVYQGPIGNANVLALLSKIRSTEFTPGHSCNPVFDHEWMILTEEIQAVIVQEQKTTPEWLVKKLHHKDCLVVGIGNHTSLFRVARDVTGRELFDRNDVLLGVKSLFGLDDVKLAKTMAERRTKFAKSAIHEAKYPEVGTIMAKLALVYAVMTSLDIRNVLYKHSVGSCAGILLEEMFWVAYDPEIPQPANIALGRGDLTAKSN